MSLTGPLAANGKQALLGTKIWEEETNKKGGLLGRPVKLIYYDDQTNPSTVPGIYTKLLDVDKVDLVVRAYATNMIAPAMPVVMPKNKAFISLFGLAVNDKFKYPNYFSMIPTGQDTKPSFTEGFFEIAATQNPKPQTVALACGRRRVLEERLRGRARERQEARLEDRLRQAYPPATPPTSRRSCARSRRPIRTSSSSARIRSTRSAWCSAINEIGYKPKMIGGAMVGLQATVFKTSSARAQRHRQLRDLGAGDKQMYAGTKDFLEKYQSRAGAEGVDPLGYYLGAWGYAHFQVLGEAIKATKSIDDEKLADCAVEEHLQDHAWRREVRRNGEWAKSGMMQVQYHSIKGRRASTCRAWIPRRSWPKALEDRQRDLSLREGQAVAFGLSK